MINIPFLKKVRLPGFSLGFLSGKPNRVAGIDIGMYSTKVVQLRYESERAILESYGELLNERYTKGAAGYGSGFLRHSDNDIATLLKDIVAESNITAKEAVFSLPASSSFTTTISLPRLTKKEVASAIPYEARKYVPIPLAEVVLDWDILETEERETTNVLLVAVPKELIEKFKRIANETHLSVRALEVETFSVIRSLIGHDPIPTAIINFGHLTTTLSIVDMAKLRVSHSFERGSNQLTQALERGLGVNKERAEQIKRDIGLGERIEEKQFTSIMLPLLEAQLSEVNRLIDGYNRKAGRKIQKVNVTGGGSQLSGIIELAATHFGIEVTRGNPFARVVSPAFMQPILREIGPSFAVAVGLALHEITRR